MVRIARMSNRNLWLDRREFLAGLGAAVLAPALPGIVAAREPTALILRAAPDASTPLLAKPDALRWSPIAGRLKRGDNLEFIMTLLRMRAREGLEPQVIALSAVIGDTNGLERWLGGRLLRRNERPVPLDEGIV